MSPTKMNVSVCLCPCDFRLRGEKPQVSRSRYCLLRMLAIDDHHCRTLISKHNLRTGTLRARKLVRGLPHLPHNYPLCRHSL